MPDVEWIDVSLAESLFEEQVDRWSPTWRHRQTIDPKGKPAESRWRDGRAPCLAEQEATFGIAFGKKKWR